MQRTLQVGERVRIHPASDWFMMGVTYGIVTSKKTIEDRTVYYLRPDTTGIRVHHSLRMKVTRENLLTAEDI